MTIFAEGRPLWLPRLSIFLTTSEPSVDLAEDHMLAIQPARHHGRDEELGAVGVRARVRHGQQEGFVVFELEILVFELGAIDGLAARSVVIREIPPWSMNGG